MSGAQQAIVFIVFLGVLVTVHELGHFLAAKWAGVKVVKFSVGFGPRIFGIKRGETEYQVAWVPLGGYVKMHGDYPGEEHDLDDPERHRGLYAAPWWKRAVIMSAGPAFNLIFPVFAYFFALLGETTYLTPRVGNVAADMPAAIAGIKPGDVITRVNGVEIVRFEEISEAIAGVDSAIPITVKRGDQELVFQLNPVMTVDESNPVEKTRKGMLGITAQASAPVVGVPAGSVAAQAGLETFDRIVSINGEPVGDEVQLLRVLEKLSGPLTLEVVRLENKLMAGLAYTLPKTLTVTLEKQPGEGHAALGAEPADLYVAWVVPGSPAEKAGLQRGDRFVSVNDAPVKSYFLFDIKLRSHEDRPFKLTWQSGAEQKSATIARAPEISYDELKNERKTLILGTARFFSLVADPAPAETRTVFVGPKDALVMALKEVPKAIRLIGVVLVKLFTGGVPLDAVGGPIAVFQVATKSAEAGLDTYLMNMALVSVNLGLVNLLPIPIFDGFALLAAFWEGIRRRPIPIRVREYANMFGLVVIAMLLVLVFKNDITKLFR
ncbi:MAG: RIP metalloprotease RseP [Myxococcaceae bacterium]|nr:RIP metalloprotease RseP [Myxococcaceae bacterium]